MFQALHADLARAHQRRRRAGVPAPASSGARSTSCMLQLPRSWPGDVPRHRRAETHRDSALVRVAFAAVCAAGASLGLRACPAKRVVAALTAAELAAHRRPVVWVEPGSTAQPVAHAANHLGRVRLHPGGRHEVLRRGRTPSPARTRWPSCPTGGRSTARDRGSAPTTPTRMPPSGSSRSSPTRTRSPDLAVVHTPRHFFPDEGGHHGEHGSLDVIQSRAPLVLSGAGVARRRVPRRPRTARRRRARPSRTSPACPTRRPARRGGGAARRTGPRRHTSKRCRDGRRDGSSASSGTARTAATCCTSPRPASCPAVARLVERGVALRGGAVAEFPSVTLTNHTSILTGTRPGPARRARQRVLRPGHRRAGRAQRRDDVAPAAPSGCSPRCARSSRWSRTTLSRARVPAHRLRRRGHRPGCRLRDDAADPGERQQPRRRRPRRPAAPTRHTSPVHRRPGLPRRRLLPLGRAGRRPRAAADAAAVGRPGAAPRAHLVGQRRDRRRSPRRRVRAPTWPATRCARPTPGSVAFLDHLEALGVTRRRGLPADGRPRVRGAPTRR